MERGKLHMPGDSDEPPYISVTDALLDGWRYISGNNNFDTKYWLTCLENDFQ